MVKQGIGRAGMKILIIDDVVDQRVLLERYLPYDGLEVLCAKTTGRV